MNDALIILALVALSTLGAGTLIAWTRDGGTLGGLVRWLVDAEPPSWGDARDALDRARQQGDN